MNMPFDAHSDLSDDALLVLFANGDPAAARLLTLRLTPRVLAFAQRMLGNCAEAEDVAQEAMLRLWRVARDWRQDQAKVSTWLFRVTSNLCTDLLRRRRSVPLDGIAEPEDGQPGALAGMIDQDRARALDQALKLLPDRQRQAVILRHLEGFTNPEIAGMMDIGVEAVESLTARGKRSLALVLAGRREELGYDAE